MSTANLYYIWSTSSYTHQVGEIQCNLRILLKTKMVSTNLQDVCMPPSWIGRVSTSYWHTDLTLTNERLDPLEIRYIVKMSSSVCYDLMLCLTLFSRTPPFAYLNPPMAF